MKKNRIIFIYVISFVLSVLFSIFLFFNILHIEINEVLKNQKMIQKFEKVSKKKNLSKKESEELLINALFAHINKRDPHSMYFNPKNYKEFNTSLNSTLVGIGIQAMQTTDGLVVKRVFNNTPAKNIDIKENDKIIKVGDVVLKNVKQPKSFTNYIRGKENTFAKLTILRNNKIIIKDVKRKSIKLNQIYVKNINKNLYLKIDTFGNNLGNEFSKYISKINNSKKLIIDLRDNSGGELSEVSKILSYFVKDKTKLLQRKVKNKTSFNYSTQTSEKIKVPVSILVNKNSASASEILSLDLKELYGAKLYGEKTYGKGSVQQLIPLNDKSAFKFTIEKWFSSKGTGIDHTGINVDFKVKDSNNSKYGFEEKFKYDKVLKKAME